MTSDAEILGASIVVLDSVESAMRTQADIAMSSRGSQSKGEYQPPKTKTACELPPLTLTQESSSKATADGHSQVHDLYNVASVMASKNDGTTYSAANFDSIFGKNMADELKNIHVTGITKDTNKTTVKLSEPLKIHDSSSSSFLVLGEHPNSATNSNFELSFDGKFQNGQADLRIKSGITTTTEYGQIRIKQIRMQPREGGNISFELGAILGKQSGCAFSTGEQVLE